MWRSVAIGVRAGVPGAEWRCGGEANGEQLDQSYLQRLVESLERIAASADAQIAWMNKTGFPPEEMRVDLIHWSSLVPSLVESRTVSPQAASALEDLREFPDSLF